MTDDVPEPPRRPNPSRGALVLVGILALAFVIGLAAVIGYLVLGRSSTAGTFPTGAPATSVTTTATSDGAPAPSSPPLSSSSSSSRSRSAPSRTPATTASGAPNGSTPCPIRYARTGLYRASSVGSSATTCGFAEEVRIAYARTGRPGQLPRPVSATSPETGETIRMICAAEGPTVTCTGGDDAVVYLY
ncbi:hypothetical protein ASG12_15970 [Williamsia sp. Leaf354]|uniref:hypothetical protein n=1 Tax=Williamsia sp. Leaf354 TaxID=1736349 RepID=UPI0006F54077|nr:hypothetical protein [Williamsia sp. Leaf354]KQR97428.1 hypothetical protein ASG12_15970 [Williamsia sp. Leaf354]